MQQVPENILLVDKTSGISSFDVIRLLRKKLNINKMGHAGTLDPLATGLMIIGINKGTKLLSEYLKLPKTYEADILLGVRTSSGDRDGEILETIPVPDLQKTDIEAAVISLIGSLDLNVPMYSAIKVDGKRLYEKAHKGEIFETPKKSMRVTGVTVLGTSRHQNHLIVGVRFDVASGTYIRSLAEELGRRLGYPATVNALRRTRIGPFTLEGTEQI